VWVFKVADHAIAQLAKFLSEPEELRFQLGFRTTRFNPIHFPGNDMDLERAIQDVAQRYATHGYTVVVKPTADQLPAFARDFRVEVVGRRPDQSVLVAVKRNRLDFAADPEMPRYAEVIGTQPGWRFDLVLLEGSAPKSPLEGAPELTREQILEKANVLESLTAQDQLPEMAIVSAWATLEAAMRWRVRADGHTTDHGTSPDELMSELVSSGVFSLDEYQRVQDLDRLRSQIVHGYAVTQSGPEVVQFLTRLTRELMEDNVTADSS